MSDELMKALAEGTGVGAAVYDGRVDVDDAVVAPARRRVRRARTVRAAGTLGATALVLAGGFAAAAAWGGDGGPVDPAVTSTAPAPSPTASAPFRVDALISGATPRTRGEAGTGQPAVICDLPAGENPWSSGAERNVTRFEDCDARWVADEAILDVAAMVLVGGDGAVTVDWTLANASGRDLEVDIPSSTVALLSAPDAIVELPSIGNQSYVASSLWGSDTSRNARLGGDSEPEILAPGGTFEGRTVITPQMIAGSDVPDLAADLASGALDATVTLQVRIPPSGEPGERELLLEASTTLEAQGALAANDPIFDSLEPRTRGKQREDAQAALDCRLGFEENPRTADPLVFDGEVAASAPTCETVWIPGGTWLELTAVDASVADDGYEVEWTAAHVSGGALRLDQGGTAVVIETDPQAATRSSFEVGNSSYVLADTAWDADHRRVGYLTARTAPVTVNPGGSLTGSATVPADASESARATTVLVRVVRANDEDGTRELLLELAWNG